MKRPRYAYAPNFGARPVRSDRGTGSSFIPAQGTRGNSWPKKRGFSHSELPMPSPHSNFVGSQWCPRCNRNHTGSCSVGKQCFACGKMGHMRRDCPTLHGYPGASRGTGRPTMGIAPTAEDKLPPFDNLSTGLAQPRRKHQYNNPELKEE